MKKFNFEVVPLKYNEDTVKEISHEIIHSYLQLFKKFQAKMEKLRSGESGNLFN
jgi:hypothetical protein